MKHSKLFQSSDEKKKCFCPDYGKEIETQREYLISNVSLVDIKY